MAYSITVVSTQADVAEPRGVVYRFGVGKAFPPAPILLLGEDFYRGDWGAAYDAAFAITSAAALLDYEQVPPAFDSYSVRDQRYIRALMDVVAAHRQELAQGPFRVELTP